MHGHVGVQVFWVTGVQIKRMLRCVGVQMCRVTDVQV